MSAASMLRQRIAGRSAFPPASHDHGPSVATPVEQCAATEPAPRRRFAPVIDPPTSNVPANDMPGEAPVDLAMPTAIEPVDGPSQAIEEMPAHDQPLDSNPADVGAAPRPRRFAPVATEPVARVSTPVPSGSFVPASVLDSLATMDREAADALEFGVIRCDDAGRITLYNRFQSRWAGVAVPAAEGKNFFTELAMCCNNRLVRGTFLRGVSEGRLDVEMTYTFNYRVRPTLVQMRLYRDPASGSNWVFILPL